MKLKSLILAVTAGILMLAPMSAGAATLTDPDGIISIETPDDKWVQMSDPNYWFVISDGSDSITIDHLSNGEHLPDVTIATDNYKGVMQSYVSTLNEVFVVKGLAVEKEDLANVMKIISTIQVLRFDTKTAITTTDTAVASDFGLRAINKVYYCTGSEVGIRSGWSVDTSRIGELNIDDKITVKGMVTKGGQDYGWYQVDYKGSDAFVNAAYLTPNAPAAKTSGNATVQTPAKTTTNSNISSKISGSDQAMQVDIIGKLYDENGIDLGIILYQFSDGSFRDDNGNFYYYCRSGVYMRDGILYYISPNGKGESYDASKATMVETIGRLYDENGLSVGSILYQFSDGTFRDDDGNFYNYVGNGVYERNGSFYYLNPNENGVSSSSVSSADAVMEETIGRLYDANGVSVGSILYRFSDGTFRDDDGNFYSYVENGVYERDGVYYYLDENGAGVSSSSVSSADAVMEETIGRLYDANGVSVGSILYQFTDGTFRDDDGNFYNYVGNGVYERDGVYYYLDENGAGVSSSSVSSDNSDNSGDVERTQSIGKLYDGNGVPLGAIIYVWSDGSIRDDDGNFYNYLGNGVYEKDGVAYYLDPDGAGTRINTDSSDNSGAVGAERTDTIGRLYDANGVSVGSILYQWSDGTFRDDDGNFYTYVRNGVYECGGQTYYTSSGVDSETALSSNDSNSDTAEAAVQTEAAAQGTDDYSDNSSDSNSGYDDSYDNSSSDSYDNSSSDSYDNSSSDSYDSSYSDSYDSYSDDSYSGYDD